MKTRGRDPAEALRSVGRQGAPREATWSTSDALREKENERKALEQEALAEFLASQGIQTTPPTGTTHDAGRQGDGACRDERPVSSAFTGARQVHLACCSSSGLIGARRLHDHGRDPGEPRRRLPRRTATAARRAGGHRRSGRGPEACAARAGANQGQHRPDRNQRVRRLRRPDCRQRRARAERALGLLQEPRLQSASDGQRGRELVRVQRRQDRRVGDDRGRAGGCTAVSFTPSSRRRSAFRAAPTAWWSAATSSGSTSSRERRSPRRSSPRSTSSSGISRRKQGWPSRRSASLDAPPHPERLNLVYTEDGFGAGDLFLKEHQVRQQPPRRLCDVGTEGVRGGRAAAAGRRTS